LPWPSALSSPFIIFIGLIIPAAFALALLAAP